MLRVEVASDVRSGMASTAVERVLRHVLREVGKPDMGELSVAFIGPKRMREINKTYHGEDRVTDVLAFSELENQKARKPESRTKSGSRMAFQLSSFLAFQLGEILICPSYVRAQAKRAGEPFQRELTRVLVHGMLHLLGHDHATPRQAEKMFGLQEQIVKTLKSKP